MRQETLRVVLVDDHALVRTGIRLLVERLGQVTVVGEAADGDEAVRITQEVMPDVVIMDVSLPGRSGIDAAHEIANSVPETKVLMLSMHADPEYASRALAAGARGYVTKGAGSEELANALRETAAGRRYVCPEIAQALRNQD